MGVAAFHQHDLAEDDADARAALRGARSISVALVVPCGPAPGSQLAAILPHLIPLASLAQDLAAGAPPPTLRSYMAEYAPRAEPRWALPQLAYDPATYLLTMHRFLGPLMLPLLKALHVSRRVLLYCPPPVERAAILAFNLAELMHASFVHAPHVPGGVRVRGLLTLHDLDKLLAESVPPASAWVAWTSDRLLLEKTTIYDISVDVSSCAFLSEAPPPIPTRPLAYRVPAGGAPVPLTWTSRDLSLYLELAEQERQFEAHLVDEGRPTFRAWRDAEALPATCQLHLAPRPPWKYAGQDGRSRLTGYLIVLMALLRFWLGEWWLIRTQLHVVVPLSLVMPLGVRGDGGMSSGIVDLGDDASVDSEPATLRRRTSRYMDALDSEPSHEAPDPLVAACGLHVPDTHRRPRSMASMRSWTSHGFAVHERTIRPAHPRYDTQDAHLPLESITSLYLFTLWSSYVRAKHIQTVAYMEERIALLPPADAAPATEAAPLLRTRELVIKPSHWHTLGLDPTSETDRALVQQILAPHDCTVRVARGWCS